MKLMYITNDPKVATIAEHNGVDRIWVDLEVLGKEERQKNMNTVKSNHQISDIKKIKPLLNQSELLVRVNPWHNNSKQEIDDVIEAGADIIMLPMWKTLDEVIAFVDVVNNRVKTTLLLETIEAENILEEVLQKRLVDEIHIGLNDLHLAYKKKFMFELISNGTVDKICNILRKYNIPFGFGGIARIGEGTLPAEKILQEHIRCGSTRVILSRQFCDTSKIADYNEIEDIFSYNIKRFREAETLYKGLSKYALEQNHEEVKVIVDNIVSRLG